MSETVSQDAHEDHHPQPPQSTNSDAADHVVEARQRARQVLAGESHLGDVDDWRRTLISARDTLLMIWITWTLLYGFGEPPFTAVPSSKYAPTTTESPLIETDLPK